jgi:hypothetical protein
MSKTSHKPGKYDGAWQLCSLLFIPALFWPFFIWQGNGAIAAEFIWIFSVSFVASITNHQIKARRQK